VIQWVASQEARATLAVQILPAMSERTHAASDGAHNFF
jgi:hypothetical protein